MIFICGYCRRDNLEPRTNKSNAGRKPLGMYSKFEDLIDHLMIKHQFRRTKRGTLANWQGMMRP